MAEEPPILQFSPPKRPTWLRRSTWVWFASIAGVLFLSLIPWPTFHRDTYIDVSSGDIMTKRSFGDFCYQTRVEQTPFSVAVRRYTGPTLPARWVFCCGVFGVFDNGRADGGQGIWPSDCSQIMKALELVPVSDGEMKSLMKRCVGYLANDQRQAMDDEALALLDRAESQSSAATKP